MNSAKLNDWMQVAGIFAVVASLLFVGLQMQQDRQLAGAQLFAETDDSTTNTAALMNENIDIWMSGSRGNELSAKDEAIYQNLFMSVRYGYASFYETQIRLDALSPDWVARKFAYQLYSNAGLRRIWNQRLKFEEDQSAAFNLPQTLTRFETEAADFLDILDAGNVEPSNIANFASW